MRKYPLPLRCGRQPNYFGRLRIKMTNVREQKFNERKKATCECAVVGVLIAHALNCGTHACASLKRILSLIIITQIIQHTFFTPFIHERKSFLLIFNIVKYICRNFHNWYLNNCPQSEQTN